MDSNTTKTEQNRKHLQAKQAINWLKLFQKIYASRKLILQACAFGSIVGVVIILSTPHEYTASTLTAHESARRRTSSVISTLTDDIDDGANSFTTTGRDAIYPSLYRYVINSTPFLLRLFDIKVRMQEGRTTMPLVLYLSEYQKRPWWSVITSIPSKLIGWGMSLFSQSGNKQEVKKNKTDTIISKVPFLLTRKESAIASIIASRINIKVDKKKRTITLSVTMQDPQVAAIVADTVETFLREYMTEYRTNKARRLLEYNEALCKEAQDKYYQAQDRYTQYADANRNLVMLTSRTELANLQSEMRLALTTYNQIEKQVRAAKARVDRIMPVYTVIQPVTIPINPSKPNKIWILAECILLSVAGSISWILFMKDFIGKIRKKRIMLTDK